MVVAAVVCRNWRRFILRVVFAFSAFSAYISVLCVKRAT
jgi:hypothetical protein